MTHIGLFNVDGSGICYPCTSPLAPCLGCTPAAVGCAGPYLYARRGSWLLYDNQTGSAVTLPCDVQHCESVCADTVGAEVCAQQLANTSANPVRCHSAALSPDSLYVDGYCELSNACTSGRTGFMCGRCIDGYSEWNGRCVGT
jgi:hypothetical protein